MRRLLLCIFCFTTILATTASAQFAKTSDAIKYRQGALRIMGTHFGRIGAVVKGDMPFQAEQVKRDAALVTMMSKLPWSAFVDGSDEGNTKAKPDIWLAREDFDEASKNAMATLVKLEDAAQTEDLSKIRKAFRAAGKACKACHKEFRQR